MSNFKPLLSDQTKLYGDNFIKHGDCADGTFNQSEIIQTIRFDQLLQNLPFENLSTETIHDVGCGICDLYPYILKRYPNILYSGTDIIPEMRDLAAAKYPLLSYYVRDLLDVPTSEKYDFLVVAGLFNLPGTTPHSTWRDFALTLIQKMYQMCDKAIAFNFLSSKATYYNDLMFYASPDEIFDFCTSNLSRFVHVNHSYPLYEFTVTVSRPDFVKSQYDSPVLNKYYK